MNRFFAFYFSLFCLAAFGQKKTDTLRLYYAINKTESAVNFSRLDSALKAIKDKNVDVAIYGFADFLSNDEYNLELSQKRADIVKKYILKKGQPSKINIYICAGKGESQSKDNSSLDGEVSQRRVDIYFEPVVTFNVADNKLETPKEEVKNTESKKNIEELNAGESLALEGLSFEPGRHFVLKSSAPVLQKLLETLKENENLKIEIQGHVCCTLNGADGMDLDTKEMKLSENRAKAIYDYLISKGIDKNRLSYKGFGRKQPKFVIESTPEEEQANRRVEILVIEK